MMQEQRRKQDLAEATISSLHTLTRQFAIDYNLKLSLSVWNFPPPRDTTHHVYDLAETFWQVPLLQQGR